MQAGPGELGCCEKRNFSAASERAAEGEIGSITTVIRAKKLGLGAFVTGLHRHSVHRTLRQGQTAIAVGHGPDWTVVTSFVFRFQQAETDANYVGDCGHKRLQSSDELLLFAPSTVEFSVRILEVAEPINLKMPLTTAFFLLSPEERCGSSLRLRLGRIALNLVQERSPRGVSPQQDSSSLLKCANHRIRLSSDSAMCSFSAACFRTDRPRPCRLVGGPKRALRRLPVSRRTLRLRVLWVAQSLTSLSSNDWASLSAEPLEAAWRFAPQLWILPLTANSYQLKLPPSPRLLKNRVLCVLPTCQRTRAEAASKIVSAHRLGNNQSRGNQKGRPRVVLPAGKIAAGHFVPYCQFPAFS